MFSAVKGLLMAVEICNCTYEMKNCCGFDTAPSGSNERSDTQAVYLDGTKNVKLKTHLTANQFLD